MSEKEFVVKPIFTARLSPEEQQMIQESIIDIVPEIDPSDLTTRKLLVRLVEIATSKVQKRNQPRPEDEEKIKELQDEVFELSNKHSSTYDKWVNEQAKNSTLEEENKQVPILKQKVAELESLVNSLQDSQLRQNELRISLSPLQEALMDETCKRLSEQLKKPVTPGPLLIDMFYRYTTKQETEIFYPFVLSSRDIKAIAAQVRKKHQPTDAADV